MVSSLHRILPLYFIALVEHGMIVDDLLALEFEGIPNNFEDRSLSPMDYCIVYIGWRDF